MGPFVSRQHGTDMDTWYGFNWYEPVKTWLPLTIWGRNTINQHRMGDTGCSKNPKANGDTTHNICRKPFSRSEARPFASLPMCLPVDTCTSLYVASVPGYMHVFAHLCAAQLCRCIPRSLSASACLVSCVLADEVCLVCLWLCHESAFQTPVTFLHSWLQGFDLTTIHKYLAC